MKEITIPVTFKVGTLEEVGMGGLKVTWLSAQAGGMKLDLTAGAGVASSLLEASVRRDGQPGVYAQADIRPLADALWPQMAELLPGGESPDRGTGGESPDA